MKEEEEERDREEEEALLCPYEDVAEIYRVVCGVCGDTERWRDWGSGDPAGKVLAPNPGAT